MATKFQVSHRQEFSYHMNNRFVFFLFLATLFFSANTVTAQTTYFSDGTSASTYGNTTYFSDGSTANTYGNTIYYNSPSGESGTASTYGNTTYYNGINGDSWTASTYGPTTYFNGANGTSGTASTYGNTTYYSGNIFDQCPAHSSYDSLTGKCQCNSGYYSNGSSCVYEIYTYSYPTTPTCPLNSYYNGTSCTCNTGYIVSGSSCVLQQSNYYAPSYSNSNNQTCQLYYGVDSYWDGTKTNTGSLNCGCQAGYSWNSTKTGCVLSTYSPPANSLPGQSDETIGDDYYITNHTCIGLSGNQYSYCVSYAYNH